MATEDAAVARETKAVTAAAAVGTVAEATTRITTTTTTLTTIGIKVAEVASTTMGLRLPTTKEIRIKATIMRTIRDPTKAKVEEELIFILAETISITLMSDPLKVQTT